MAQHSKNFLYILSFFCVLLLVLLAVFFAPRPILSFFKPMEHELVLSGAKELNHYLKNTDGPRYINSRYLQYDFQVVNLPDDLAALPAKDRSSLFISAIVSHALFCNKTILQLRKKLIVFLLHKKLDLPISAGSNDWFIRLARQYSVPNATPESLLERIDIIPVSLIVDQAIIESGWGTSRFSLQGNALYGQHLPQNSSGKYITSLYGNVKVAAFNSIGEATKSYIHNLNTAKAYQELRTIRARQRLARETLSGYSIAAGLQHYSELGEEYIADLRFLLRKYKLEDLDTVAPPQFVPVKRLRFSRRLKPTTEIRLKTEMTAPERL